VASPSSARAWQKVWLRPCIQTLTTKILTAGSLVKLATKLTGQGVVITNSPVEPSATGIKVFDQRKYTLIA